MAVAVSAAVFAGVMITEEASYADASGSCGTDLTWEYSAADEALIFSGKGTTMDSYGEKEAPWYGFHADVKNILFTESLVTIGDHAFEEFTSLEYVDIPASVEKIGAFAFNSCIISGFLSIPENVKSMDTNALYNTRVAEIHNYSGLSLNTTDYSLDGSAKIISSKCGTHLLWDYTEDDSTLTFIGSGRMCDYSGSEAPWHKYRIYATNVVLPDGLTHIGKYALNGFNSLVSVTIPCTVTSIGDGAFYGCSELTALEIPSSVKSIGAEAFSACKGLVSLEIPDSVVKIGERAFSMCAKAASLTISESVTSIADRTFYGCSMLQSVVIPDSVTEIGVSAFAGCSMLQSVVVSKSVTKIGASAFAYSPVKTVYNYNSELSIVPSECGLPSNVNILSDRCGKDLFWQVTAKGGVRTLTIYGFGKMCDYTSPDADGSASADDSNVAPWYLSYSGSVSYVVLPKDLETIGTYAFSGFVKLKSVTIPETVVSIGAYSFSGCSDLASLEFSEGSVLKSICDEAFGYCTTLSSVTIPGSVTSIGCRAFACTALSSATVPGSVTEVGEEAFFGCGSLEFVSLPLSLTALGENVFSGCPVVKVFNYSGIDVTAPEYALDGGAKVLTRCGDGLLWEYIEESSTLVISGSGVMYDFTENGAPWFAGCGEKISSVVLPEGLECIGANAFKGLAKLTSADVSCGVTSIGEYAFSGCSSLKSVSVSCSLEVIGDYAFNGCSSLDTIIIPCSVISIGDNAFAESGLMTVFNHSALDLGSCWLPEGAIVISQTCGDDLLWVYDAGSKTLTIYGTGAMKDYSTGAKAPWYKYCNEAANVVLQAEVTHIGNYAFYGFISLRSIELPETVESIGNYAFCGCSALITLDIPDSVVKIGDRAFGNCRSLESVSILGSAKTIGNYAFCGCSKLTVLFIPATVGSIGRDAFGSCPIETVYNYSSLSTIKPGQLGLPTSATVKKVVSAPSFSVSFFNGDSSLMSVTETVGRRYVLLNDLPSQGGSEFLGWFNANDFQIKAGSFVTPDDEKALYARWGITVSFCEGTEVIQIMEMIGSKYVLPEPAAREGQKFISWVYIVDGVGVPVTADTIVTENDARELYTTWEDIYD